MKFKSILEIATTNIMSVSRKDTLKAAAEIMFSHNIRNVLVVDEGITEYGIITVKDIAGFITSGVDFSNTIESLDVKSVKQIDKDMSALDASFMIRGDISYLCVVDETKKLLGIVSMSNIISSIDAELVVNDIRLGHIIGKTKAKTASQNESLKAVFEKTNATQIEAVIVIADNSVPLGIITKRDIVKLIIGGIDLSEPVGKYMKSPLVVADEDTTVKEALELMGVKKFKRLIVVEKSGELLGAITREEIMDIVYNKWSQIVREKEGELRELTRDLEAKTAESERNVKWEKGVRMNAVDDAGKTLFLVFSPDSTQVELFFSEEGVSNEILDRRGLPAGGYAWNVEDDDTKNVRLEDGEWTVSQRGRLIYQEDANGK